LVSAAEEGGVFCLMSKASEQYNIVWFVIVACGGHVREPTFIGTLHLVYMDSTFYLLCFCPLPCPVFNEVL